MIFKRNLIFNSSFVLKYLRNYKFQRFSTKIEPKQEDHTKQLNDLLNKHQNSLLYSEYLENRRIHLEYHRNLAHIDKEKKRKQKAFIEAQTSTPLPLSLQFINIENNSDNINDNHKLNKEDQEVFQLPYETSSELKVDLLDSQFKNLSSNTNDPALNTQKEVEVRYKNWMADYENYEKDETNTFTDVLISYGTPDPKSKISNIPCGGCGALLHCKNSSIPGYIPSEIYKNSQRFDGVSLKSIICQRCYFLREYNLALQVRVSPDDYPKILKTLKTHNRALTILIVDLLDFPSSIWPGAADLIGRGRPIFVVGNKIDLLPQDGPKFLNRIEDNLRNSLKLHGFGTKDIEHVALVSATTGFGIESLITKLQKFWEYRGDVFLVGCANVGKSSLFNKLLQSDYCKTHAVDLIQRATISQWPGTTLNLLKFPINRPSGYKLRMRSHRLRQENKDLANENFQRSRLLRKTNNPKYATLIGRVGQTFASKEAVAGDDIFSVTLKEGVGGAKIGIDENDKIYAASKWCFDTPGVIQSEQVLHLLTTEELVKTLPKSLIRPKTFLIHPETTIFIGGLSRLDFMQGEEPTKFTVFCSSELPITLCATKEAEEIYEDFLQTDFFAVPVNNPERLKKWPGLTKSKIFTVEGIDKETSCADVVLSTSGWISITPSVGKSVVVKGFVPLDCGIHLRDPLLPNAVRLRGKKIRGSVAYYNNRFYIPK